MFNQAKTVNGLIVCLSDVVANTLHIAVAVAAAVAVTVAVFAFDLRYYTAAAGSLFKTLT